MKNLLKNPYLLAGLSACLLRFSFPKFDCWLLAWFAFVPVFFAVDNRRLLKCVFISFLFGFLFFCSMISWLSQVTFVGMVILSVYLGMFCVCFFSVYIFTVKRLFYWQRLSVIPAVWIILEYLRGCGWMAFPWGLLGYSQAFNLAAIQGADIFGVYGVSYMVIFTNLFIFELIRGYALRKPLEIKQVLVPVFVLLFWFSYGVFRVNEDPQRSAPLRVSVVQGNISQDIKWVYSLHEKIFEKYKLLSEIVILKDDPDLVVWPETSFPDYLEFGINDQPLRSFAAETGRYLLAGSIRLQDMNYFNSALLFSPEGEIEGIYDKIHLVPFGEYIPARKSFPFFERILPIEDFTPGSKYEVFLVENHDGVKFRFSVLMCFEDIFDGIAANFIRKGADFLINMTNDAWFGDTASPYQHMQASILRAVENRAWCLRAANTGISCFIDDIGLVVLVVEDSGGKETFATGAKTCLVYKTGRRGFYPFVRDFFILLCALYAILMITIRFFTGDRRRLKLRLRDY